MLIRIVCAGRIKEKYFSDAVNEYKKRIGRFASVEIMEVADERIPENFSTAEEKRAVEKEGERIMEKLDPRDYVINLCIGGKRYDSEGFAAHIKELMDSGHSRIAFVIGGSAGLSQRVLSRGNETFSMSDLTFPHRLARVVLTEQLFRAFKIINGEAYHK